MLNANIEMNTASEIFKLLGHETRLTMLKILDDHDCCVCEFVEIFQATQPSISQHIRKLKDSGLIKEERRGQWIYYSLNEAHESFDFIKDLLHLLPAQDHLIEQLKESRISCD